MSETPAAGIPRRHDLDALRAFAMLLGIGLHASLSFTGYPWIVQDTRSSALFALALTAIHGFRMQLFMLVSGYFTMMLWRKRGLKSLMKQRAQRVLAPLLLGLVTIVPALELASMHAGRLTQAQEASAGASRPEPTDLFAMIRKKDLSGVKDRLAKGDDPKLPDDRYRIPPLAWAALYGDVEIAELLIEKGADIDQPNADGSTPLHHAVFSGHANVVRLLLDRGADPTIRAKKGQTAADVADLSLTKTNYINSLLNLPTVDVADINAGRSECRKLLAQASADRPAVPKPSLGIIEQARTSYDDFIGSDRFLTGWTRRGEPLHLFRTGLFHHLWFLWFLCWLVAGFAAYAVVSKYLPGLDPRRWPFSARTLIAAAIGLTLIPQFFMGIDSPTIGPDTSTGILPYPHLLVYYGVFFAFGAIYFDREDAVSPSFRRWRTWISYALLLAFPLSLATMMRPVLSGVPQVIYTWTMIFGLMGAFRVYLGGENRTIRYLSDSAYWLYLAHLPLIVLMQAYVRPWDFPVAAKFVLVCTAATIILLLSYQAFVRDKAIGRLLNGPRKIESQKIGQPVSNTA